MIRILFVVLIVLLFCEGQAFSLSANNYEAVILGKVVKKEVKNSKHVYLTEYKINVKKWLFKKEGIKEKKNITISVLGAELPEKGLVIKASTSPDFIPLNKQAIFLLEKTKLNQSDIFTVSKGGIILKEI